MRLATWNVNSLTVRLPQVLKWLQENRPNVLCMQETKITDDRFTADKFTELGYHCEYFGEKTYNGVAIISDLKPTAVQKGFKEESPTASRRFLEICVGGINILDVYIPNGSEVGSDKFFYKLDWMQSLHTHLSQYHKPDEMLVVCGDYNIAPEDIDVFDPEVMRGQIHVSDAEREALHALGKWGLIDAFRLHNSGQGHYSWWDYRMGAFRRNMGLRIDHIWATRPLSQKCLTTWIDKAPRGWERPSDHAPVVADFDIPWE